MHTNPYRSPSSDVYQPHDAAYDDNLDLDNVASGQKLVIYALLAQFSAKIVAGLAQSSAINLLAGIVVVMALIASLFGMYRLASGLGTNIFLKIFLMVFMLLPIFNLIFVISGSIRATRVLRAAGYQVGLLGVKG